MLNENYLTTGQHWLFSKKNKTYTSLLQSWLNLTHSSHAWTFYNYIVYNYDIHVSLLQFSMMLSPPTLHDSESDQREITLMHSYCLQYYHVKQCDFNLLMKKKIVWVSFHFNFHAPYLLNKVRNIIIDPCVPVYDSWLTIYL